MNSFWSFDHSVFGRRHIVSFSISKQISGAFTLSSKSLSAALLSDRVSEDTTFEGIALPLINSVAARGIVEDSTLEGVGLAFTCLLSGAQSRCLDSLILLVAEDVGVLVGGSGNFSGKRFVSESVLSLLSKLLVGDVVRLIVEDVTAHVVVIASASVVVNDILVRVTQDIGVVLSRLQIPRFHLNLIFIR